jgi:hypothetical protein
MPSAVFRCIVAAGCALAGVLAFAQDPKDKADDKKAAEKVEPKADEKKIEEKKKEEPKKLSPLEEALDRYYEAGKNIKTVGLGLREVIVDQVIGKKRERAGKAGIDLTGGKFRIEIAAKSGKAEDVYLYDGSTYWQLGYARKQINAVQQPAGSKPKRLFELGRGPFPLPIGQTREQVLDLFEATLLSKPGADPAHVKLKPRPGVPFGREYLEFEFKARIAEGVPFEIITRSKAGLEKTYLLENVKANDAGVIPPDFFRPPDVNAAEFMGWSINIQQQQPAVGPPMPFGAGR